MPRLSQKGGLSMVQSSNESQQTQTFSIDHENVLPEHYRLIELIGRGGMAEVYLAEDRRLGRKVAIKFLNPQFRRDADRVRRFRQEARSASALNHPNILIIHDIGDRGGVQFIVSEFVEGETLGTRIAQGKLSFAEAVDVAIQAASALAAAHSAGIVHRDIKPDNVMIRNDGVVKVLDFGLAKARGFSSANGTEFDALTLDSGSTSPGLIVGTPQYMSPEQARGKELDGRTDIFSLGIIIFEMVTRHSPFASGNFADTMAAILTKEPRRLEEFVEGAPARIIALVERCLRKDREERFLSMAELETELKLLRGELVDNPRATAEVDALRSDRTQIRPTDQHSVRRFVSDTFRHPSPIAAVIILVAAGLLIGGWWAWDRLAARSTGTSLMRTVPITTWSSSARELVSSASFSPDGRLVAYAIRNDDAMEIWVKPVVGGDPVQVTKSGGYNQYPVWSPNGEEIAYLSDRGNSLGIWRIPFTGGNPTKIFGSVRTGARPISWGSEGQIYFQSIRELLKVSEGVEPTAVTDFSAFGTDVRTIEVSRDEASVAYSLKRGPDWKIMIRAIRGGPDLEIGSTSEQIDYIAWHPNGKSVFASLLVEGSLQVVEFPTDGSGQIQRSNGDINFVVHDVDANGSVLYGTVSETSDLWRVDTRDGKESIVANEVASEYWPDVGPNGSIAYQSVSRVEQPTIGTIKVQTPGVERSSIVSPSGFNPVWSNKGDRIAFLKRNGSRNEVWIARPDGVDSARFAEEVAVAPGYEVTPYLKRTTHDVAWSPDDLKIAVVGPAQVGTNVWVAPADGSASAQVLEGESGLNLSPIWTRDGRSIILLSVTAPSNTGSERSFRIFLNEVDTSAKRLLFETKQPLRLLGLTGDGESLVFALNPDPKERSAISETIDVYRISLIQGAPSKVLTLRSAYFNNVHLSADGSVIGFVTRTQDQTGIATSTMTGDSPKQIVVFNDPKILISSLGLSRDGSFIVFGKQTRTNLLSMLTN